MRRTRHGAADATRREATRPPLDRRGQQACCHRPKRRTALRVAATPAAAKEDTPAAPTVPQEGGGAPLWLWGARLQEEGE